jgi:serine/threonine-protein phosphatase 6 regulatory ankyrin repeat subunit B
MGCSREIHESTRKGNAASVEALLKKHPELVNNRDADGWTPLQIAADCGKSEVAEILLAAHADVNAANPAGYTALHLAVSEGHKGIVALLLTNKVDVNAKENSGMTPLYFATAHKQEEIAELLRKHGATGAFDPLVDKIVLAASDGDVESVKVLIKEHPDLINASSPDGMTPLHHAAVNHRIETVAFLLANHADLNAKDISGCTPLFFAATTYKRGIVELMIAHHADVNAKSKNGATPLHGAASGGLKETVMLLLDHGADVNAKDNKGKTPILRARESAAMGSGGRTEIIELLQKRSATVPNP